MKIGGEITTEYMLKDLIDSDKASRKKSEMIQGVNYYNSENDILARDFREFYVDGVKYIDYNKSNDSLVNNFHQKLVDQKTGYIAGKPIVFKSKDGKLIDAINYVLGNKFHDVVQDWVQGASNKGFEDLHAYINKDGEFDFCTIPGEQIINITDTTYNSNITQVIRYYAMEWIQGDDVKKTTRVEVWDNEKVTKYQEVEDGFGDSYYMFIQPGTLGVTMNPQYHWYTYNTTFTDLSQLENFDGVMPNGMQPNSWGRIPFVCLKNNTEERSDLIPIKKYIDALDIVSSGFLNDLKDIQLAIWVLRGYEAESEDGGLAEFMLNLQKFKAINLSNDDSSSAEPKTLEIPQAARMSLMDWLEKKIYDIGKGVNEANLSGGSITNVVIQSMYAGLDSKSNKLITKMKSALTDFMYFVVKYINDTQGTNYNYKDVEFVFNKSMIFNEKEMTEKMVMVHGKISRKTFLSNLPFIDNAEEEERLIEEEKAKEVDSLGGGLGFDEVD